MIDHNPRATDDPATPADDQEYEDLLISVATRIIAILVEDDGDEGSLQSLS